MDVLIKLAPTLIFAFFVLLSLVGGLIRGFRKSLILFIHYVFASAIGFVLYFVLRDKAYETDFSSIFGMIGNVGGMNFSDASTLNDVVKMLANNFAADYAGLATIPELQTVAFAFASIAVNTALFILLVFIVPFFIRMILRLIYQIFYSESKKKRNCDYNGEDYRKHRIGGMLVGIVRGIFYGTLAISTITSIIFIATAGGAMDSETVQEVKVYLEDLDVNVAIPSDVYTYYQALSESRSAGIGVIFDAIRIDYNGDGEADPIDYFFFDSVNSSKSFESVYKDEEGNPLTTRLVLRKEVSNITSFLAELIKLKVISYSQEKGIEIYQAKLDQADEVIETFLDKSVIMKDILPLAVIGLAKGINQGYVPGLSDDIKSYFNKENIALIENIDYKNDLKSLVKTAVTGLKLLNVREDGTVDLTFAGMEMADIIKFALSRDTDTVKSLFTSLGNIQLVTKALLPIGYSFGLDYVLQFLSATAEELNLTLSDINWAYELSNFGPLYEQIKALDIDFGRLLGGESTSSSSASSSYKSELADPWGLIDEIAHNDDKVAAIHEVIDLLVAPKYNVDSDGKYQGGSYLLGNTLNKVIVHILKTRDFSSMENVGDTLKMIQDNIKDFEVIEGDKTVNEYSAAMLNADLHLIVGNGLKALPIALGLIGNTDDNIIARLKEIDVSVVREAVLGTRNSSGVYEGGLFDIMLLSHKDGDKNASILGDVISSLLKTNFGETLGEERINSVLDWKEELSALFDAVEVVQGIDGIEDIFGNENILSAMPEITDDQVNRLTAAMSSSIILSGFITDKLIDTLDQTEALRLDEKNLDGSIKSWRDYQDVSGKIVWEDKFEVDGDGNYVIVDGKKVVAEYGEINHILKALVIFTKKDENGNSKLVDKDGNPNITIDSLKNIKIDECDTITNSTVLTYVINKTVTNVITSVDGLTMPNDKVIWANEYWSYEGDYHKEENLKKIGELWALIKILSIDELLDSEGNFDAENITNMSTIKKLGDSAVDRLVDSQIILANLAKIVDDNIGKVLGDEHISSVVENTKQGWGNELKAVIEILKIDGIVDDDGNFDVGLDTIANLTGTQRETFAKSNILMKGMSTKIAELSSGDLELIVPEHVKGDNWKNWAYQELDANDKPIYSTGEFYKIADIIQRAKLALDDKTTSTTAARLNKKSSRLSSLTPEEQAIQEELAKKPKLDETNFVEGMIKMNASNHLYIMSSDVIYATLSNLVMTNENIEVRAQAKKVYDENDPLKDVVVIRAELAQVLDILRELEIFKTDNLDINTNDIIDKASDADFRELICTSNIVNITAVSKICEQKDNIDLPSEYDEKTDTGWYYTASDKSDWASTELNRILVAITELNGNGVSLDGDKITVDDTTTILKKLNTVVDTEHGTKRIEKIYSSRVMAYTITTKVKEQEIDDVKHTGTIRIRSQAYEDASATDLYLRLEEMLLLVDFVDNYISDFENVNAEIIFDAIGNENAREELCKSNIFNVTIVDKVIAQKANIDIPSDYDDISDSGWYYPTLDNWRNCELNHLLEAINELHGSGININGDEISIGATKDLLKELNKNSKKTEDLEVKDTKIGVIYDSRVMAFTITTKVREQEIHETETPGVFEGTIRIRSQAYENPTASELFLQKAEMSLLVAFVAVNNLDIETVNAEQLFALLDSETARGQICQSNILNVTVVDKVVEQSATISLPSDYDSISDTGWYYTAADKSNWASTELNRLLIAINEIYNVKDDDDNNVGIIANGNNIEFGDTGKLLNELNKTSKYTADKPTEEKDTKIGVIYDSKVMAYTITMKVKDQEIHETETPGVFEGTIRIRNQAYENASATELFLKKDELRLLVAFLGGNNIEIESVTAQKLFNLIASYSVREQICTSNILNVTVVNKIVEQSTTISLPSDYDSIYDTGWYYADVENHPEIKTGWDTKELNKILVAINELNGNGMNVSGDNITFGDTSDLLKELNETSKATADKPTEEKDTKIGVIYDSRVMAFTITTKVKEQEIDDVKHTGTIRIRNEAYENASALELFLQKDEMRLLIAFLGGHNINISDVNAQVLFNLISDYEVRQELCTSNILNITIVDKVVEQKTNVSIPVAYQTITYSGWYYTSANKSDWASQELNKMLVAINELNGDGMTVSGNNISFGGTDELLFELNKTSKATADLATDDPEKDTKIGIIYESRVLAFTITKKIKDQEINDTLHTGTIRIRNAAYENASAVELFLLKDEVRRLVSFLADNSIKASEVSPAKILGVLASDDSRQTISLSNILNVTFVDQIITKTSGSLYIPWETGYATYNTLTSTWEGSLEGSKWYPANSTEVEIKKSEIYKLLTAMNVAGITVDGSGNFDVDPQDIIDNHLTSSNIGLCFSSDVIGYTLSHEIINGAEGSNSSIKEVNVVNVYDGDSGYEARTIFTAKFATSLTRFGYTYDFLTVEEAEKFIAAIQIMNLGVNNTNAAGDQNFLTGLSAESIDALVQSGIVNKLISDSIISQDVVTNIYPTAVDSFDTLIGTGAGYKYINAFELRAALNTAVILEISNTNNFQNIGFARIASLTNEQIAAIEESYIFCKIFSRIVIENKLMGQRYIDLYNNANPSDRAEEYDRILIGDEANFIRSAKDDTTILSVLLPSDIAKVISYVKTHFSS